jgi:A/G-specific adenine glycosylase
MLRINEKKIKELQEKLLDWYTTEGREFPWRAEGLSDYQIIIAETLLQRTKAETVAKFYTKFIDEYPTWDSIVEEDSASIEEYIKPIGLYHQRSFRLINLAKEMIKRGGRLPRIREELDSIPFMGQYIANAVELVIFNRPTPLIDVNMARLLERYFGPRKMADIRYDPYLQKLSYKIVNHLKAKEINWAILDFAALVCKARTPLCDECKLNRSCSYYKTQLIS